MNLKGANALKHRISAIILAFAMLLGAGTAAGCGNEAPQEEITQAMQLFVRLVADIGTPITLSSEADIDAALLVYNALRETQRENPSVAAGKSRLDGYRAEFDALVLQAETERREKEESTRVSAFLQAVSALPAELSAEDREGISAARELYEGLSEESKALPSVSEAYSALKKADSTVTAIEQEEHKKAVRRQAEAFMEGVAALGGITLSSGAEIGELLQMYAEFSDEVLLYEGVSAAKEALDRAYAEYTVLKDEDDVKTFLSLAEKIGKVTLESEAAIYDAEKAYERLSANARRAAGVADAYEQVRAAREAYGILFEAAERVKIDAFLAAVGKIPSDLGAVDMSWFDVLSEASEAYNALAFETRSRKEVSDAFSVWNAAQTAFDAKGYKRIPISDAITEYSADAVPFLLLHVFQTINGKDNLAPVKEFYGVTTTAELSQRMIAYLDIYVDGNYITKTAFDMNSLAGTFILRDVVPLLRPLQAQYPAVQSGANFSFSVHFEDREGKYIPSAKSPRSQETNKYVW